VPVHDRRRRMNQARSTQPPKTVTKAEETSRRIVPQVVDGLGFYRILASFPALATFRAKVTGVVLVGTLLPAFLLIVAILLGPVGSAPSH
jgi:hypothetical protein